MNPASAKPMSNTSLVSVPEIGDKAPDFELPDVDQKWRQLSEFRDKKTISLTSLETTEQI
jgi:peroxiredoxin